MTTLDDELRDLKVSIPLRDLRDLKEVALRARRPWRDQAAVILSRGIAEAKAELEQVA